MWNEGATIYIPIEVEVPNSCIHGTHLLFLAPLPPPRRVAYESHAPHKTDLTTPSAVPPTWGVLAPLPNTHRNSNANANDSQVKQAVEGAPGAANTVRALKLLGDKIGNMASDLSFIRGGGSTLGKGGGRSGRGSGSVARRSGSLDPRDRKKTST